MRFGVLGPLVAADGRGPVELPGPRHREVLARLLAARGRVVPVDRLVADLWEAPPDGAVGAVQTFVSALRRVLEPDRPPRAPARLLVTEAPGYALRVAPDAVDAWRFESVVMSRDVSPSRLDEALGWWRGPAYAEFAGSAWARGEAARLDELRLLAVERRAELLVASGRSAVAVPDLEAHVEGHPWREDAWRLLASALYHAGRQGDALRALRRARAVLAEELGVDPGPGLRRLEADVLAQSVPGFAPDVPVVSGGPVVPRGGPAVSGVPAVSGGPVASAAEPVQFLVGRDAELARLASVADSVVAGSAGRPGLVLVSGEAGAGKTALVEAFAARLRGEGWTVAWGANPDADEAPAAWPWTRVLEVLGGPLPDSAPAADAASARSHWHRAVVAHLGGVARRSRLLLVVDDVHWAGEETVALLAAVLGEPVPLLVVATYRDTDPGPVLTGFLGRAARAEPVRVHLAGLSADAVAELVRRTTGREPGAAGEVVHRRSGGNPFFVRELARLLESDPELDGVPEGVRDVVRHRVARLPGGAERVLRHAAVIGTEVELDLLQAVEGDVLDELDTAVRWGFLVEDGPSRHRFAHALVRDTLYRDLSRARRARLHRAVADAVERLRPDDVVALAHHLLAAGDTSARTARVVVAAAGRAESRFAFHEAVRLYRAALDLGDARDRLEVSMGLVRTLAVTGDLEQSRRHRSAALDLAESSGDPEAVTRVITAFDTPAIWTEPDDPALSGRIADAAERALAALPPDRVTDRSRLLATIAVELRGTGGERGRAAAGEAEALARRAGDPAVLAFALNARFLQCFERAGLAPSRAAIGEELVALATRHDLVTFAVLGHLILVQARSALADFAAADRHTTAVDRLAEVHRLPLVGVFTDGYRALRASVAGVEDPYRGLAARLRGTGMTGLDVLPLARACHAAHAGRSVEVDVPDDPPRDLLYEARACLRAVAAIRAGDRATATRLYAELLPAADELAGAGSGLLTLRPVSHYLGDLATALGDADRAAAHYRRAAEIARKAGAPQWAAAAEAALR